MAMKKTYFFVFLFIILGGIYFAFQENFSDSLFSKFQNKPLKDSEKFAVHIHPHLEIEILGKTQVIPAGIGLSQSFHESIHTHDLSGEIHVESPVLREFYLSEFFSVWKKSFNETCIMEYCIDENHTMSFYVNEVKSDHYGSLLLRDLDRIKIIYQEKNR